MAIVLFDNDFRKNLYPLTLTKAVAALRLGIVTIAERWQLLTGKDVFILTENYLQPLYKLFPDGENIFIDASIMADDFLIEKILSLQSGEALKDEFGLVACKSSDKNKFDKIILIDEVRRIKYAWNLFQWNDEMLKNDFKLLTKNRSSQKISSTNNIYTDENIFIENGAVVEFATLNSATGPIYIGKNAQVFEGTIIRGSFAALDNSVVKAGAKIYGATTIGINCTAGGEIKNSILSNYSNKAHDGYLGDSVVGEWCNFGAGTSNSNVKNNANNIFLSAHLSQQKINVGKKCGLIMGDYSRVAIQSAINTASVFGVCCNIFGNGLLPKIINNFMWENEPYNFNKVIADINNWMKFKNKQLSSVEIDVLKHIFAIEKNNN